MDPIVEHGAGWQVRGGRCPLWLLCVVLCVVLYGVILTLSLFSLSLVSLSSHGAGWQGWSEAACSGEFELDGGGEVRVNSVN